MSRLQEHKTAKEKIREILKNPNDYLIIHYSSEHQIDNKDYRSPRITSIAVKYLDSENVKSFSIHLSAEILKIAAHDIEQRYDDCEADMLKTFFKFVEQSQSYKWLHWSMRNSNYGFYAIEHRFRVLVDSSTPTVIENKMKIDISELLKQCYGNNYIGHRRIEKLLKKNNYELEDFLTGEEEVTAFDEKQYIKLHKSTLRKVRLFHQFLVAANNGSLKIDAKWYKILGITPQSIYYYVHDKWWFWLISVISGMIAFYINYR